MTGESRPVAKSDRAGSEEAEARALAGTLVTRGRGRGIVTQTGPRTEVGRIAGLIAGRSKSVPPLLIRLDEFSRKIALSVGVAIAILLVVGYLRGLGLEDLFLMAVGLAVSAIPEGLPVAISVVLAIGMRRMARENVLVRNMPALETLGSCTMIATDKTGTLTMNELTVTEAWLPDGTVVHFEAGRDLDSSAVTAPGLEAGEARERSLRLLRAASLPNEAMLDTDGAVWSGAGDTVDIALLAAARKSGLVHRDITAAHPAVGRIPYEPELKYAASFHAAGEKVRVFVKGAPDVLIAMADRMQGASGPMAVDRAGLIAQNEQLTARGLRVLAFAEGEMQPDEDGDYGHRHLVDLVFLGFAAMQDPLRPEAPDAVRACRAAGIEIAMITGDDPRTAAAIAAEAGLMFTPDQVVTGEDVRGAEEAGQAELDALTRRARIYARVVPAQKLAIVLSMARNGHFVAVTGDGVNDAPALKHAHVGVAMGRKGTDVARESADIIVTDDNFASVVAGIRQGRVAYANIRKVIFMQVSTGAAEVALFLLALPFGLPIPLLPVQLLWLNLVTNGIQDVFLAAERAEGDELTLPPRDPKEPIFDGLMIRRVLQATVVMGGGGFALFWWLLENGRPVEEARNLLLLLFVLFEAFQTFNSRSERHSVFTIPVAANPLLVAGVVGAALLHVAAMHVPVLRDTLSLQPASAIETTVLLALASVMLVVMEVDKWREARKRFRPSGVSRNAG